MLQLQLLNGRWFVGVPADDQGLGKTVTTIAFVMVHTRAGGLSAGERVIVV
jgi:hypothetical protein